MSMYIINRLQKAAALAPLALALTCCTPDPQVPVNTKDAGWIEIVADGLGIVGYMLIAGKNVEKTTLDTDKGVIEMVPNVEHWYSPSIDVGAVADADELHWQVRIIENVNEAHATLIEVINTAGGLPESSGEVSPSVVGPAGAVSWEEDDLDEGTTSFNFIDSDGEDWYLSMAQEGDNLSIVNWATGSMPEGRVHLPEEFIKEGLLPLKKAAETPANVAVFKDYAYQ